MLIASINIFRARDSAHAEMFRKGYAAHVCGLVTAAYIVAAILFIFSLAGLSEHETSQQGIFGIAGMAIALKYHPCIVDAGNVGWIILKTSDRRKIGIRLAKKVEMTEMPELVGVILHSFVGLAAVLVGFNSATAKKPVWSTGQYSF